jgi:c-di-GMP-binding flagellar brake protein YcgR
MEKSQPVGKNEFIERRKYPRLEKGEYVFYQVEDNQRTELGITEDISAGGLRFETDKELFPSSIITLEIYESADIDKQLIFSMSVLAKVVWTRKMSLAEKYEVGVKFMEIMKKDRNRIRKYIDQKLRN